MSRARSAPRESEAVGLATPRLVGLAGYLLMVAAAGGLFLAIRAYGERLDAPPAPAPAAQAEVASPHVDVVFHVLATLATVVVLGYLLGRAMALVGQPPVIGEVLAGLLLGPSLLGAIWPRAARVLAPDRQADPHGLVLAALEAIAQLGIVLYMFLVGLELNGARLRKQATAAILVAHASILVPLVLGAALAVGLYPLLSHRGVPFTSFALFMGVAMAITAFPVLARILSDQGLDKTPLGILALSSAATGDVTAWCLLALVVGVAQSHLDAALYVALGALAFIAVMLAVVRPFMAWTSRRLESDALPTWALAGSLAAVLGAGLATERIGIHAVFGAFLLGAVIPHDSLITREFSRKLSDLVTVLMLPAFFALTGLRTEIGLLDSGRDWLLTAVIIVVATVGKLGGTIAAARACGISWREASALGALMNTRGLMELIVLNIGLDLGILSPKLFAMMVLMALATTLSAAPLLRWLVPGLGGPSQPPLKGRR